MVLTALNSSRQNAMKLPRRVTVVKGGEEGREEREEEEKEEEEELPRGKRQRTEEPEEERQPSVLADVNNNIKDEETQPEAGLDLALPPATVNDDVNDDVNVDEPKRDFDQKKGVYTSSIYVDAFNLALDTVLKDESYLFSEEESTVFAKYRSLGYEAQHLYVRLFLRKTAAWFRQDKLQYHKNIADLPAACAALKRAESGFADNTDNDDDDDDNNNNNNDDDDDDDDANGNGNGNAHITLEEVGRLLNLEELRSVAREVKCGGAGMNKTQIIAELKKALKGQTGFQGQSSSGGGQLKLSFDSKGKPVSREKPFVRKMLQRTGPCIRLNAATAELFNRVHLVFYRSTEWSEKSLTTVILSRTGTRSFPSYIVSRTSNIFPTRQALLDFEAAIKLQSEVDEHLTEFGVPSEEGLQKARDIFESIYPVWETMVAAESAATTATTATATADHDAALERIYLRRFQAAWVYTRIVHKGVYVLGRHKAHAREHAVLTALLAQPYFQPARRGAWYQRKALIEETYLHALTPKPCGLSKDGYLRRFRTRALATCEAGLQDPQTHIIYHHDLQKRITKLEGRLKMPKRVQHDFSHTRLVEPTNRTIFGRRAPPQPDSDITNTTTTKSTTKSTTTSGIGRKTLWIDSDPATNPATDPPVSVEALTLSHYRAQGWKGYHSESSLPRTLFAYLFHDLLFLYLPNVFETQFQTAPLDLFTDAFYPSRASEINHRLVEIANGGSRAIIRRVYDAEGERKPCVVGLDWSFPIEELEEIVECFPSEALAGICKVLAEEYRQRSGGGVPDLFLWRMYAEGQRGGVGAGRKGECMFVEVKSQNDRLSDTQRLWIHVLSTNGVRVELCAVRALRDGEEEEEEERLKVELKGPWAMGRGRGRGGRGGGGGGGGRGTKTGNNEGKEKVEAKVEVKGRGRGAKRKTL